MTTGTKPPVDVIDNLPPFIAILLRHPEQTVPGGIEGRFEAEDLFQ
jgi:hypothetical protein